MDSAFPGPLWATRMPVRFIHRGAWSDTVEAREIGGAGRATAVKVAEAGGGLEELASGWAQAARSISTVVRHANVITYREVHLVDGWLSAERPYVEGVDIGTAVASAGPAPPEVAAAVARAVAEGVAAVHEAGVTAGRLTPSHILVGRDGAIHVLHAGVPEVTRRGGPERASGADREVAFAPPERFAGSMLGKNADVFGVASLLHLLSVGRPAIPETHRLARVLARRGAVLVARGGAVTGIDAALSEIVTAALGDDPGARPALESLSSALASVAAPREEVAGWTRAVVGEAALGDGRE